MQREGPPLRNQRGQSLVGIAAAIPKAQPARDPRDMRIHRKSFMAKREKKHDVCRLFPHTRQGKEPFFRVLRGKLFEERQGELAPLPFDSAQNPLDAVSALPVHPRRPDGLRHLLQGSGEKILKPWETRTQSGVSQIAIAVGGVLGKNGAEKELQRVVMEPWRVTEGFAQAAIDLLKELGVHGLEG